MAEIHLGTGQLRVALDYASQCLTMSRCHHFGSLEMHAMLLLARIHVCWCLDALCIVLSCMGDIFLDTSRPGE